MAVAARIRTGRAGARGNTAVPPKRVVIPSATVDEPQVRGTESLAGSGTTAYDSARSRAADA
ncbi:hypothetical protein U5640_14070 [Streptomyces sp. SS7]|uniref:hypothetical protein n=1 Tax=Streptomyces sp. SS7 TaxID=3108485 RepID=UPI0030EDDE29